MKTRQIINEARELLHEELTDPNTRRRQKTKPWIYTHQPNTSSLPTIQIHEVDAVYNNQSIGNYSYFEDSRIQFTVRVRTNSEYDYNADNELETASDGLDHLIHEIREKILSNQDRFKDLDNKFKSLLPDIESNIENDPDTDAIQKSIDFIARIEQ